MGQQQRNAAVLHQIPQTFGRVRRVQRHVSAPGLEDRQQADNHLRRALDGQPHAHLGADTQLTQAMSQAVGTLIEVVIAEGGVGKDQRHRLGANRRLRFDQLMHALRGRWPWCRVPVMQQLLAFTFAQPGQLAQAGLRGGHHGVQQARQMLAHAGDHRGREVAELVTPGQAQMPFIHRRQRQRVVGALVVVRQRKAQAVRGTLLQGLGNREVFKHQQAVEQRLTRPPGPTLHVTQRGEFVLPQLKVMCLQTAQPLRHAFSGLRLADHRQGIDEQPELMLGTRQVHRAPRDRGAERDRLLAAVPL